MKAVGSVRSVIELTDAQLPDAVSAGTRAALAAANITALTPVQRDAIPQALQGADVLAKGKTGTGKTLAFLVPTVERLLTGAHRVEVGSGTVRSLILTSARELATQIATEAERLLSHQGASGAAKLSVVTIVGGRGIGADLSALATGADLLVATPGRLGEHVEKTEGFVARLGGVETLVLDEADQLVEGGFLKLVESLLRTLPPSRQTLCFSATLPVPLMEVLRSNLRADHVLVGVDDSADAAAAAETGAADETHSKTPQAAAVVPMADTIAALIHAVRAEVRARPDDFKVVVFLPTARLTQFAAETMRALAAELPELPEIGEIHSKKSPSAREKASDDFRAATTAVLLSSDVSARGVDYPDVTFVLQVGAPTSKAQYVHRVGRTGRGSSEAGGRGLLLLCDFEARFLRLELKGEPIRCTDEEVSAGCAEELDGLSARALAARGAAAVGDALAAQTYTAFLSHYANLKKLTGLDKDGLVAAAALFATKVLRRAAAPAVPATLVGTLGLKGAAGLLIEGEAAPGGGSGGAAALTPEELASQKAAAKAEKAAAVRAAKAEAGLKAKAAAEARRAAAAEATA